MVIEPKFDLAQRVYWADAGNTHKYGYVSTIVVRHGCSGDVQIYYNITGVLGSSIAEELVSEDHLYKSFEELETARLEAEKASCESRLQQIEVRIAQFKGRC
jgi:hypothetical protein